MRNTIPRSLPVHCHISNVVGHIVVCPRDPFHIVSAGSPWSPTSIREPNGTRTHWKVSRLSEVTSYSVLSKPFETIVVQLLSFHTFTTNIIPPINHQSIIITQALARVLTGNATSKYFITPISTQIILFLNFDYFTPQKIVQFAVNLGNSTWFCWTKLTVQ